MFGLNKDSVAGKAREFGGRAEEIAGEMAGDTETRLRGRARQAAGQAQGAFGSAGADLEEITAEIANRVQEKPLKALLVAGGIGFVLGLIVRK